MNIPEMLKELMSLGFTQRGIAIQIGTTQPTIFRAINGADVRYELGKAIESLYEKEVGAGRLKRA
jgi:predicted transcriptional regulator